jgi:imidazolonepropionase-like amidohydrolase
MIRKTMLAALALTASVPALSQTAPSIRYIQAGHLLDRPGQAPRGASTLIVRDGRVAEVRDGFVAPEGGAELVDLRSAWVLPGLIDMHVHLWGIGGDPMRARVEAADRDDADNMVTAIANMRATLDAGFTTVRDLGGDPRGMRALRQAVAGGTIPGPTIVNAGKMLTVSGGHGDAANGKRAEFAEVIREHQLNICDGPVECARAVRLQVAMGAEVIKFGATGGVLSNVSGGLGRAMTPEEMRAIIDTAHGLGRRVAAHSHAAEGSKAALAAGVDTIDHGTFLDDETIALFKAKGAWLVPTMMAPRAALAQARGGMLPPATISKAEAAGAAAVESHRKAIRAGVKIAFGTDTGVSRHGDNAQEFALLVDAGMTPAAAIRAATLDAADALGMKAELGSLEPGKWADLIAVAADPLADVRRLETVDFVMRRGIVHKLGGARQGFPAN